VTIPTPPACLRCNRSFTPRRSGGHRQRFCSPSCRRAHDAAARATGRATIDAERATVPGFGSGARPTRALGQQFQGPTPVPSGGMGDSAPPDTSVRFLVEIPFPTIEGFVRLGWLPPDQRDDFQAIMAALRRLGWAPTVKRLA
jgi:hypothetical protein